MKKLLPLLLVFLGIVVFVFVIYQRRMSDQRMAMESTTIDYTGPAVELSPEPTPLPEASFTMSATSNVFSVGVPMELSISLDTGTTSVYSADVVLQWDPVVFQLSSLVPGPYFPDVQVFRESYDQENGMAYYTLGSFTSGVGQDTLVTATFLPLTQDTQSSISLTEQSVVAGQGGISMKLNLPQQVVFSVN